MSRFKFNKKLSVIQEYRLELFSETMNCQSQIFLVLNTEVSFKANYFDDKT